MQYQEWVITAEGDKISVGDKLPLEMYDPVDGKIIGIAYDEVPDDTLVVLKNHFVIKIISGLFRAPKLPVQFSELGAEALVMSEYTMDRMETEILQIHNKKNS